MIINYEIWMTFGDWVSVLNPLFYPSITDERSKRMSKFIDRLEAIGDKVLDGMETKPIRTIITSILVIWLIAKVVGAIKRAAK